MNGSAPRFEKLHHLRLGRVARSLLRSAPAYFENRSRLSGEAVAARGGLSRPLKRLREAGLLEMPMAEWTVYRRQRLIRRTRGYTLKGRLTRLGTLVVLALGTRLNTTERVRWASLIPLLRHLDRLDEPELRKSFSELRAALRPSTR